MIDERFAILAGLLNIVGCSVYFIGTIKGTTKPNRVTWFLWALAPLIAFFAQIQQGVGLISFFTLSNALGPLLVLVGSFVNKHSLWKITLFDISCGVLSLLGLFFWYLTQVGNIAIFFSIASDLLAAIPTIVKAYRVPETENARAFLVGTTGSLLGVLTINTWTFANYGFALYALLCNGLIFLLVQFKIGKQLHLALAKKTS